jgi:hypothetical protein
VHQFTIVGIDVLEKIEIRVVVTTNIGVVVSKDTAFSYFNSRVLA